MNASALLTVGLHGLTAGSVLNPWILGPAVSPSGEITGVAAMVLIFLSASLFLLGAVSFALGYRRVAGRALIFSLLQFGIIYGLSFFALDWAVGRSLPQALSGRLDVPKADLYGWGFSPRQQVRFVHPDTGEVFIETMNAAGWHDTDHPRVKTRKRVLLLGDSQVWGPGLRLEQTIGRQLERHLGPEYEVISMGYSNFGTDQEYLALLHEGIVLQPDHVIVLMTMGNDFADNSSAHSTFGTAPKPHFNLEAGELVSQPFSGRKASILRRIAGKSHLCVALRVMLGRGRSETPQSGPDVTRDDGGGTYHVYRPPGSEQDLPNLRKKRIFDEDWSPDVAESWDLTLAILREIKKTCSPTGASVILYPNFQFPPDYRFPPETIRLLGLQKPAPHKPFQLLMDFCRSAEIGYVEEPVELRSDLHQGRYGFRNDPHLNPIGADRTAQLLASFISETDAETIRGEARP
ncbi:hypothetical protein HQ520_13075 [bacterium]|nr:hypothetical protein [bacterium]